MGPEWTRSYVHVSYWGHEKGILKPVNYEKLREITHGLDKNPALFQSRLTDALRKYTNLDPFSPKDINILALHFIGQ